MTRCAKTALFLCLAGVSINSYADWIYLGTVNNDAVLVDNANLTKQGRYLRNWILWKYQNPRHFGGNIYFQSSKMLVYADCQDGSIATRTTILYPDKDGLGKMVHHSEKQMSELNFRMPPPDSMYVVFLEKMCAIGGY